MKYRAAIAEWFSSFLEKALVSRPVEKAGADGLVA